MKLANLLIIINESNFSQLLFLLKHSKCKQCKLIYEKLLEGEDFFVILNNLLDDNGKILLNSRTLESLNILGTYMLFQENYNREMKAALRYPLFLLIMVNVILFTLYYIISISKWIILFQLILLPIYFISLYIIKNKYIYVIKIFLLRLFFHNKIKLEELMAIMEKINVKIDLENTYHPGKISHFIIGIECESLEEVDIIYSSYLEELPKDILLITTIIGNISIFIITLIILFAMGSTYMDFIKIS